MRASLLLVSFCASLRMLAFPVNFSEAIQIVALGENHLIVFTGSRSDLVTPLAIKTNAFPLPPDARLFSIHTNVFYTSGRAVYQINLSSNTTTQVVSHSLPLLLVGTYDSACVVREFSEPGRFISFDPRTKKTLWRSEPFQDTRTVLGEKYLYVFEQRQTDDDFDLIALDLKTGKTLWHVGEFSSGSGDLLEFGSKIFVADQERLHVLATDSGKISHSFKDSEARGWLLMKSAKEVFCVMVQQRGDPLLGFSSNFTAFRVDDQKLVKLSELDVTVQSGFGLAEGKGLFESRNATVLVDLFSGKTVHQWPGTPKARLARKVFTFVEHRPGYSIHSCDLTSGEAKAIYEFASVF